LPLEVGSGDVAEDRTEGAACFVEEDGEVGGDEAGGGEGDERGEVVALHVGVEGGEVVDEEVFGGVHGWLRRRCAGLMILAAGGWEMRVRDCPRDLAFEGKNKQRQRLKIQGSLHCASQEQERDASVEMTRFW